MTHHSKAKLTAGELGHIWEDYMNHSMAAVILTYFHSITEADDIRSICKFAFDTVTSMQYVLKDTLDSENYPIPRAFSDTDLNPNAPKLFTDEFVLFYLNNMAKLDLGLSSITLADAVREDIRTMYTERHHQASVLFNRTVSLLLELGLFVRSPLITSTHQGEPKAQKGFLSNFFGVQARTLTALEANELHKNLLANFIGKSLLMGFDQSNRNGMIHKFLIRGKELASKIMRELSDVLIENDLPVAMTWDTLVLDSRESPFSERLIAFHVDQLNRLGIANYGYAAAISSRKDLKTLYARIIAEVYQYEVDLKTFMIENEWLELPPVALDRR